MRSSRPLALGFDSPIRPIYLLFQAIALGFDSSIRPIYLLFQAIALGFDSRMPNPDPSSGGGVEVGSEGGLREAAYMVAAGHEAVSIHDHHLRVFSMAKVRR